MSHGTWVEALTCRVFFSNPNVVCQMVCERLRTAIRRADFAAFRAALADALKPNHTTGDDAEERDVDRMTVLLQLCAESHGARYKTWKKSWNFLTVCVAVCLCKHPLASLKSALARRDTC